MLDDSLYKDREQTLIKHVILDSYLERFAHIIGSRWPSITYVDCFSGPWQQQSESFEDTSFGIALKQLRLARKHLKESQDNDLRLRCFFLEKDRAAFTRLASFVSDIKDVEISLRKGRFEDSIDDILAFIEKDKNTFPFIFVDPKGWKGISLETIRPLLQLDPGELIVNFMTSFVKRFLEHPGKGNRESIRKLYATDEYPSELGDIHEPMDKEDAIVDLYCRRIGEEGNFQYVSKAVVLHPDKDSTHFHLIYASRHPKGLQVFKSVERKAMQKMEDIRMLRSPSEPDPQIILPGMEDYEFTPPTHYELLRGRYSSTARSEVVSMLNERRSVPYDEVWATTLKHPLSWEQDLKVWIKNWGKVLDVQGLQGKQRVPRVGQGIILKLLDGETLS